jgi:hypothetical protein
MDALAPNPSCKMCGSCGPLVKSHILPESLYPHRLTGVRDMKLYSRNPAAFPKRSPTGVWDNGILCAKCEKLFQGCDDYAQKILRACPKERNPLYFSLRNFDYALLKRFFLGLLWRASVSSQEMFSEVNVGPKHEKRLRELILSNDPGEPEEYAVWISIFDDTTTPGIVLQPARYGFKGVNLYRFVIAGFSIFVKVDQRPTPPPYHAAILRPDTEVPVVVRQWAGSLELNEMLRVIASAKGP